MSKTFDFLKDCGVFWVSTVNGDRPAARPFGAVMERRGQLYISTSNRKEVYAQLKEHPAVQITALRPHSREWIRISGTAVETLSPEDKHSMFQECPVLSTRYGSPDCEFFALFRIDDMAALLCTDQGKTPIA